MRKNYNKWKRKKHLLGGLWLFEVRFVKGWGLTTKALCIAYVRLCNAKIAELAVPAEIILIISQTLKYKSRVEGFVIYFILFPLKNLLISDN